MKETKTETIKKILKIQPKDIKEDKHNIQIEIDAAVTRTTSRSDLLANRIALERDLENLKGLVAEVENKLKDLDALIVRIDAEIPP